MLSRFTKFIRVVHRRPELDSYICEIFIKDNAYPSRNLVPELSMHPYELAAEVGRLCLTYHKDWLQILREDPEAIDLALLVYHTRYSLRTLYVPCDVHPAKTNLVWEQSRPAWLDALLHCSQSIRNYPSADMGRQNLRGLKVDLTSMSILEIAPVTKLPSLRSCTFGKLDEPYLWNEGSWPLSRGSSGVTSLRFDHISVHLEPLTKILYACRAFTAFEISGSSSRGDPIKWYADLLYALAAHSSSLVNLRIHLFSNEDISQWEPQWPGTTVLA